MKSFSVFYRGKGNDEGSSFCSMPFHVPLFRHNCKFWIRIWGEGSCKEGCFLFIISQFKRDWRGSIKGGRDWDKIVFFWCSCFQHYPELPSSSCLSINIKINWSFEWLKRFELDKEWQRAGCVIKCCSFEFFNLKAISN